MQHNIIQLSTRYQIHQKVNEELKKYCHLVKDLQIAYLDYKFPVAHFVAGAMGSLPKLLTNYLKIAELSEKQSKVLISKLVIKSITGTVKSYKTFLNFSNLFNNFDWF